MLDTMKNEFERRFAYPDREILYERPSLPLDMEVVDQQSGLRIPYEDLEMLKACARWEIDPPFYSDGRASFIPRNENLNTGNSPIRAYKIKGLGACSGDKATPPRDEQFFQRMSNDTGVLGDFLSRMQVLIHTGVNPDGSFHAIIDPPKPIGGMRFSRAKAEFENAKILMTNGVPAIMPVAYGKYKTLQWEGEPMGFVILATTTGDHLRVGQMFEPERNEKDDVSGPSRYLMDSLSKRFDYIHPNRPGFPMAKFIHEVSGSCGRSLRGFNDAGLCRFAGHTGNYSYDLGSKTAILHDLDSSAELVSLAPLARGLSIVRDLESALFGLIHSFLHSKMYNFCNKDTVKNFNPFEGFLIGYFGNTEEVRKVAHVVLARLEKEIRSMPRGGPEFVQWWGEFGDRWNYQLMELVMPIFMKSELGQQYPLPYGPGEVFKGHYDKLRVERERVHQEELLKRAQLIERTSSFNVTALIREILMRGVGL